MAIVQWPGATDWDTFTATYLAPTSGYKFRAAGIGVVDNKNTKSKGVMVTEVNPISSEVCAAPEDGTIVTIPDDGTAACLLWPDKDNNVSMKNYFRALLNLN